MPFDEIMRSFAASALKPTLWGCRCGPLGMGSLGGMSLIGGRRIGKDQSNGFLQGI
jgi:hypothetical protein